MTRDHDKPESGPYVDERVSRSYRDAATETAPEHLDAAVLAKAAGAARPRYARSLAWTRPVAWAATIALCAAIVLELTRAPQPDGEMPAAELRSDAVPASKPAPARQADAAAPAEQPVEPKQEMLQETVTTKDEQQPQPAAAAPLDADAFRPRDTDMLQRARETAEIRSSANREPAALGAVDAPTRYCDAEAVATPETWLDCIEGLEESGLTQEAAKERRLLEAAFPDFDAR